MAKIKPLQYKIHTQRQELYEEKRNGQNSEHSVFCSRLLITKDMLIIRSNNSAELFWGLEKQN